MMFYSGFPRKEFFRFPPGMTIILARRGFLQERFLPVPGRWQSAAFPSKSHGFGPSAAFFALILFNAIPFPDNSLHFASLFSS